MKKKILIVSDTPTHPVIGGNRKCITDYSSLLRNAGYDVWLMLVNLGDIPQSAVDATAAAWGDRFLYFAKKRSQLIYEKIITRLDPSWESRHVDFIYPRGLNKYIEETQKRENFHGLIVNYIWLSRAAFTSIPVKAIFTHDVFGNRSRRIESVYAWRSYDVAQESKALERFPHILAIQDIEAAYFRYLAPTAKVEAAYSPAKFIWHDITGNHDILFFSGGGELNLNGLRQFLTDVWPIVHKAYPDSRLLIGGSICRQLKQPELPDGVELKGMFDDASLFWRLGDVAINPVYSGTGLKIKTIEALANGKLTVVHPHSAEGLFEVHSSPLRISDTPEGFAEAILDAFNNPANIAMAREAAKEYITRYNTHILSTYSSIFS